MTMIAQGSMVSYKGGIYVVIMTPEHFRMRIAGEWHPAYMYTSATTGQGFAREEKDFETKFKEC